MKIISFKEFLKQQQLQEMATFKRVTEYHLNNSTFCILTAFRSFYDKFNAHEAPEESRKNINLGRKVEVEKVHNIKNNKLLENQIKSYGYSFIKMKGYFIEQYDTGSKPTIEDVFFVLKYDNQTDSQFKSIMFDLAEDFYQDSILIKELLRDDAYLVGTKNDSFNENLYPTYKEEMSVGTMKIGEGKVFSIFKGKEFRFTDGDYNESDTESMLDYDLYRAERDIKIYDKTKLRKRKKQVS